MESCLKLTLVLIFVLLCFNEIISLDNGLAKIPPAGWMVWERFRCNIDCNIDPVHCISENLFKRTIDVMASQGYRDVGYEYVSIDDCWSSFKRDHQGRLQPDPKRFPSGIPALADYAHSHGLKLGIYSDVGPKTCAGYPGSGEHMELDAQTFASWGIDMLKLDGCYANSSTYEAKYLEMGHQLNKTGRPILYDCSWPAYQVTSGKTPNYAKIAKYCNMWRNYVDIQDSWDSVKQIIDFYGNNSGAFLDVSGPGNWNSADELIIGDFSLSYDQQKAQFALWAMFPSTMFMSTDLSTIDPNSKAILLNQRVLKVHQDPLAKPGRRVLKVKTIQVWYRPLSQGAHAIVILNTGTQGTPTEYRSSLRKMGVPPKRTAAVVSYDVTEIYSGKILFKGVGLDDMLLFFVNVSGVVFLKCLPV